MAFVPSRLVRKNGVHHVTSKFNKTVCLPPSAAPPPNMLDFSESKGEKVTDSEGNRQPFIQSKYWLVTSRDNAGSEVLPTPQTEPGAKIGLRARQE